MASGNSENIRELRPLRKKVSRRVNRIEQLLDRMADLTSEAQDPTVRARLKIVLQKSKIDLTKGIY